MDPKFRWGDRQTSIKSDSSEASKFSLSSSADTDLPRSAPAPTPTPTPEPHPRIVAEDADLRYMIGARQSLKTAELILSSADGSAHIILPSLDIPTPALAGIFRWYLCPVAIMLGMCQELAGGSARLFVCLFSPGFVSSFHHQYLGM